MWGVVLGVFAAAVFVVVLNEVFKQRGIEVVLLAKYALKAEITQLVDDGTTKGVALGRVGDEFADPIKQGDLGAAIGLDCEDVVVGDETIELIDDQLVFAMPTTYISLLSLFHKNDSTGHSGSISLTHTCSCFSCC